MKYLSICVAFAFVFGQLSSVAQETPPTPEITAIENWQVLGPFATPVLGRFFEENTPVTPESHPTVWSGLRRFTWKEVAADDRGFVDLDEVLGQKPFHTAFVIASFEADMAGRVLFGFGSDDDAQVWLNGGLVHEINMGRELQVDQDVFDAEVVQGINTLAFRVDNQQIEWGVQMRQVTPAALAGQLREAASRGDLGDVERLLSLGADPSTANKAGINAYHVATIRGYADIGSLLVEASPTAKTPLPPLTQIIEGLFDSVEGLESPGATVLVAKGDEVLYEGAFGAADVSWRQPMTVDTRLRIGSISKQFTAAAILKLAEEGELEVQDPLSKFYPDYPRGDEITIHHLLTHTSGIPSYTSFPDFVEKAPSGVAPEALIARFRDKDLDFDPGTAWSYNNSAYFLLGELVAKLSGQSFAEYLETAFFEPLGMDQTAIHDSQTVIEKEARGYSYVDGELKVALDWDMSNAGGAGALYSTVADLHRWNLAVFRDGLLSASSLEAAMTAVRLNGEEKAAETGMGAAYGYGWMLDQMRGVPMRHHGGGLNGWNSFLLWVPEYELTVAVLANALPLPPGINPKEQSMRIVELVLHESMEPRQSLGKASEEDIARLDDYVGRYDYVQAVMTVRREGDRLFAVIGGQPEQELFPAGGDQFYWKVAEARVRFLRDDEGEVVAGEHEQGGSTFRVEKLGDLVAVALTQEQMQAWLGAYDYGSGRILTVSMDNGTVMAQLTGQPAMPLTAVSENELQWQAVAAKIEAQRDEEGHITAVRHFQGGGEILAPRVEE